MPQTKPIVSVENVVASASVDQKLDLIEITKKFPDTEYHPEQFPGLVFRLKTPRTATLIFRTGKMVCTGAKSEELAIKAEKHLGRRPEIVQTTIPVEEKPIIPDVVIPETPTIQKMQTFQSPLQRISSSTSKNSKLMLGVGGVALVIIIAVAASFSGISDVPPTTSILGGFYIQTDLLSYDHKDIISISGESDTSGTVNLSIENKNNELVWTEQVSIKSDGRYTTLAIAAGLGWENSGIYTIKVDNGVETKSNTFSFTA